VTFLEEHGRVIRYILESSPRIWKAYGYSSRKQGQCYDHTTRILEVYRPTMPLTARGSGFGGPPIPVMSFI